MTGGPGGVTALPCAICSGPLDRAVPCQHAHPDHCHSCASLNFSQGFDAREHRPPPAPVLTPREQQAVSTYTRHLLQTVGARGLAEMLTEDAP